MYFPIDVIFQMESNSDIINNLYMYTMNPTMAEWLSFLLRILEVPGSYILAKAGHLDWGF
jgi:hypothetical protein